MNSYVRTLALSLSLLSGHLAAATFVVQTTVDGADAFPGDGICSVMLAPQPGMAVCTLRAAIMEANATAAADIIELKDGATYKLTLAGRGEDNGATGDLDILQPVTISTPLVFGLPSGQATIDADGLDRVFDIIQ